MPEQLYTRKLTVIAKDPGFRLGPTPDGPMALVQVDVPAEILAKGPTGYRVRVVDYNATERVSYEDQQNYQDKTGTLVDPFACRPGERPTDADYQKRLLEDPNFHAQNAYAVPMRTLGVFERALGRRVGWSTGGHQLYIAPHAFAQANAFYSKADRALLFGYFYTADDKPVFTCLSHDIVAHETTHALIDGLRPKFMEASRPDQAAFHEGFSDIVVLMSIFSLPPVVAAAIGEDGRIDGPDADGAVIRLVDDAKLKPDAIKASILLGLAKEVGDSMPGDQRGALRRSVLMTPKEGRRCRRDADEHLRGEALVAAMMNSFINLWHRRIEGLGRFADGRYNLGMVVEEGVKLAGHLLTMAIRAIDYCPPTDIDFSQYLAALLTADRELVPTDEYGYRAALRTCFADYGITVPKTGCDAEGCWTRFRKPEGLAYARSNYQAMTRDPDELFRFLWENRAKLDISERAETQVLSIDASSRIGPDGIALHETICQYVQWVEIFGSELKAALGIERPDGMKTTDRFTAYGGGSLILDQYGRVKYHICNPLDGGKRQLQRAEYLLGLEQSEAGGDDRLRFAQLHQHRLGA